MSSLAWRIKRLRAMRPQEILFRFKQAALMRQEIRRTPSDVAAQASTLLATLPLPTQSRTIRFFDFELPYPEVTPDWHTDPKTGVAVSKDRWPEIDYRKADEIGSAKNIWELNRHQFLEEWAEDRTDDAALAVVRVILSWIAENQSPFGINWSSSLEPAFRMMSWQRALEVLGKRAVIDTALPIISASVKEQCDHIESFPSLFSSANNHLIGELTGLLAGACIFDGADWAKKALGDFEREILLQVTPDGVDREQAIFYHDYVLGFLQRAKRYVPLLRLPDDTFPYAYIDKMMAFSDWMQYAEGAYFEIGDRDDGIPPVERTAPYKKESGIGFWEQGGYAIWHSEVASMCFRAGKFGYPSIAAHAHCDQLSVLLAIGGIEVFTDSGTYCYHEDDEMRRYFKGTSAHNTIRIDGVDQAEYGGPFLWSTHADAELLCIRDEVFEGLHFGYLRLGMGTVHGRRVALGETPLLKVDDLVTTKGDHEYELFWNLGPGCSVSTVGENKVELVAGGKSIALTFESTLPFSLRVGQGRFSRRFGEMQPIERIEVNAKGGNWSISTIVEVSS